MMSKSECEDVLHRNKGNLVRVQSEILLHQQDIDLILNFSYIQKKLVT